MGRHISGESIQRVSIPIRLRIDAHTHGSATATNSKVDGMPLNPDQAVLLRPKNIHRGRYLKERIVASNAPYAEGECSISEPRD